MIGLHPPHRSAFLDEEKKKIISLRRFYFAYIFQKEARTESYKIEKCCHIPANVYKKRVFISHQFISFYIFHF